MIQRIGVAMSTMGGIIALFETLAHVNSEAMLTLAWAVWTLLITRDWKD